MVLVRMLNYATLLCLRDSAIREARKNPFVYGHLISRKEEKRELVADVLSGQPVMMHASRRYGKKCLVRVVARRLLDELEILGVGAGGRGSGRRCRRERMRPA